MSKAQDVSSPIIDNQKNTIITTQMDGINEEKKDYEQDASELCKLKQSSKLWSDKFTKNVKQVSSNFTNSQSVNIASTLQAHQKQQQSQQTQTGECNLISVLIERLRTILGYIHSSQNKDNYLISKIDCEADIKSWIAEITNILITLHNFIKLQNIRQKRKLNLNFFEEIVLADILAGFSTVQDTLKQVDIDYSVNVNSANKLHLLNLISNLVSEFKIPDSKLNEWKRVFHVDLIILNNDKRMNTISLDELTPIVKQWPNENATSCIEPSITINLKNKNKTETSIQKQTTLNTESNNESDQISLTLNIESNKAVDQIPVNNLFNKDSIIFDKNAINQHRLQKIKKNTEFQNEKEKTYDTLKSVIKSSEMLNNVCKDDGIVDTQNKNTLYYQQNFTIPTRYNKFIAKKSKIKRANTIDIPNYLQLNSNSSNQINNSYLALKRPIDIGNRIMNGYQIVIPCFEPKTDYDRKFLALINRNTDGIIINSSSPFKTFNYYQTKAGVDKNWSDRFSNIKTNFDKLYENQDSLPKYFNTLNMEKKLQNTKNDGNRNKEKLSVNPTKKSFGSIQQNQNSFIHASSSLFQKITKPKVESVPFMSKSRYNLETNLLHDKLKIFDQEYYKSDIQSNNKCFQSLINIKFNKPSQTDLNNFQTAEFTQNKEVVSHLSENIQETCYPHCQLIPLQSDRTNSFDFNSNNVSDNNCNKSISYIQTHDNYSLIHDTSSSRNSIMEKLHLKIPQNLHEFSKLPNNNISKVCSTSNNLVCNESSIFNKDIKLSNKTIGFKPKTCLHKEKQTTVCSKKNSQNQMISSDGIITHYPCAIGTVSSILKNPEVNLEIQPLLTNNLYESIIPHIKETRFSNFNELNSSINVTSKIAPSFFFNKIIDRNILQQNLSTTSQESHEINRKENISSTNSSSYNLINSIRPNLPDENRDTQRKLQMLNSQPILQPLKKTLNKLNTINLTSIYYKEQSPIKNSMGPIDSSEEYLLSCTGKQKKNIVLSKSESWHQLAMAKNARTLKPFEFSNSIKKTLHKQKSPSSLKLSKQFEALSVTDKMRKMEKKVQRYFQESTSKSNANKSKQIDKQKIENEFKIQLNKNINNLSRSHTMPHLHDDKLFEENIDVDIVFDRIFKEVIYSNKKN